MYGLGKASRYACPECHGVLAEIEEGRLIRFRCHTGHGYSLQTLAAELDEDIDESLWNAARALEEKMMLIERACANGGTADAHAQIDRIQRRLGTLRSLLMASRTETAAESVG